MSNRAVPLVRWCDERRFVMERVLKIKCQNPPGPETGGFRRGGSSGHMRRMEMDGRAGVFVVAVLVLYREAFAPLRNRNGEDKLTRLELG